MKVNIGAAERQAFGARFEVTRQDESLAEQLKQGRLVMSPHKEWRLPESPSWTENPFGDNNWQFQYHALRWLDPLRRVAIQGDDEAKALWQQFVQSWLRINPPGGSPSKWAWTDMGDALRTFELTFALPLFADDPTWLVEALRQHADWLAEESHLGHGNHAFHQHQALFVVACVLEIPEYRDLAVERLEKLLESSYDDQGINEEGSVGYQEQNYRWWEEALRRLELEAVSPPANIDRLGLAPISLAHATQPDGQYVRLGDVDSGGPARINTPETLYVSSAGKEGHPPEELIKVYKQGYIYGRSGWGETERDFEQETFFSLSFGKQNKIHGHQDGGSITFFAAGQPWLTDTGKFTYGSHPMRRYVVNRSGHNLLQVRDRPYDRSTTVELSRQYESATTFDVTLRDTGYEGVLLSRRVIYSRTGEYLVVLDRISSSELIEVDQQWHCAPNVRAIIKGGSVVLDGANAACRIDWLGSSGRISQASGSEEPFEGWTSTGWKRSTPTTLLKASRSGEQVSFNTVIGALEFSGKQRAAMRRLEDGAIEFTIPTAKGVEYLIVEKSTSAVSRVPYNDSPRSEFSEDTSASSDSELTALAIQAFSEVERDSSLAARTAALRPDSQLMMMLSNPKNRRAGLLATALDIAGSDVELPAQLKGAELRRRATYAWRGGAPLTDPSGVIRSYKSVEDAGRDLWDGVQSARFGPMMISAHSAPARGDTLIVGFHGALDRGKYSLPRYERLQGLSSLDAPHLIFSDPTLDLDPQLTLGWYMGAGQFDLQRQIASFIQHRMSAGGYRKVALSGSSGGGFAALQIASMIPGSLAVVFNPQTRVRQYFPRFANLALDTVFGSRDLDANQELRVDIVARFYQMQPKVSVYYVQNSGDSHHEVHHRKPFADAVSNMPGVDLVTIFEDWGRGHKTPSNDVYLKHLSKALDQNWK